MKNEIDILELFSGIGGFSLGFQQAGFKINNHYFSEVDKHCIANYKYNFPDSKYVGSVKNVRSIIQQVNSNRGKRLVITFGSPCQDFSLAGKGEGLEGSKSSLIKFAIFLVKWLRPDVFVWENVKGAFSTNDGADYWAIIKAFANLPDYGFEQQLVNSSWVLPQNRERIYIVGHLGGRSEPGIFPFTKNNSRINEGTIEAPNVRTLTAECNSGGLHSSMTLIKQINDNKNFGKNSTKQQDRVYSTDGIMACIPNARTESKVNIQVKAVLTPNRIEKRQNGRRFKEDVEDAFTLSCQDQHGVMIGENIRRLTETECERLQGFDISWRDKSEPKNWTKFGIYDKKVWTDKKKKTFEMNETVCEVPKTERYRMCGNAVSVDIIQILANRIRFIQS